MPSVSYVYPNVAELNLRGRGGLLERWQTKELECDYIEVPADFIKNTTEIKMIKDKMPEEKLDLCDVLKREYIDIIYKQDLNVPKEVKYVLHTETSHQRKGNHRPKAKLRWNRETWREEFVGMVISISNFFNNMPAAIIEIHPGDKENKSDDILKSIELLLGKYSKKFRVEPLVLLENMIGQSIQSGKEIQDFWDCLLNGHPHLQSKVGIVLDVSQLYKSVGKKNFMEELDMIPPEALKGFHIHYFEHKPPNINQEIPWEQVFERIRNIRKNNSIIINPEVNHKNDVEKTLAFCKKLLSAG